jgi:hypothetical protein
MNFGQHWRTPGIPDVPYAVILPGAYVAAHVALDWVEYVADARADPTNELDAELRRLSWPASVEVALADPIAAPLVLDFWAMDLLGRWFDAPPLEDFGFVLNTIDEARLVGGDAYIAGKARPHDPRVPYAYQDV